MATFKVGQRVRIVRQGRLYGKEGTITRIHVHPLWRGGKRYLDLLSHRVVVDGFGSRWPEPPHRWIAFEAFDLVPLTDPGVDQMIERLTRPVPFIEQLKDMATDRRKVHNEGEKA